MRRRWLGLCLLLPVMFSSWAHNNAILTLAEAEQLATIQQPDVQQYNDTPADDHPADAHFSMNVENPLPDNPTYKNDATLVKLGIKRPIPFTNTASLKYQQAHAKLVAERKRDEDQQRALKRDVRQRWLQLYHDMHALALIQAQQQTITAWMVEANKPSLDRMQDYLNDLSAQQAGWQQKIMTARAELAELTGQQVMQDSVANQLPIWPPPPPLADMQRNVMRHPRLQADVASIYASRTAAHIAVQRNKPTMELGFNYGVRQTDMMEVDPRASMIGLELSIKLPSVSRHKYTADNETHEETLQTAQEMQQLHYRQLFSALTMTYTQWQTLQQQTIDQAQIMQAQQAVSDALRTYLETGNNVEGLLQANTKKLALQLKSLAVEVALARARADLLYYE